MYAHCVLTPPHAAAQDGHGVLCTDPHLRKCASLLTRVPVQLIVGEDYGESGGQCTIAMINTHATLLSNPHREQPVNLHLIGSSGHAERPEDLLLEVKIDVK